MSIKNANNDRDLTACVATLMALITKYVGANKFKDAAKHGVVAGSVGRDKYGDKKVVFHDLMDACMVFIANYGNTLIRHPDLLQHLYRIAHRNYQNGLGTNIMRVNVADPLKEVLFHEEVVNDRYKDVRITFVPTDIDDMLLTYTASVPLTDGTGEHLLEGMIDKMKYCYVGT